MRATAMIIAVVGGVLGILAGMMEMAVGDLAIGPGAQEPATLTITLGGLIAQMLATVAIAAGLLSARAPLASAIVLLAAGAAGFVSSGTYWLAAGAFCLLASALLFVASRRPGAATAAAGRPEEGELP